jgi:hypothetical protein
MGEDHFKHVENFYGCQRLVRQRRTQDLAPGRFTLKVTVNFDDVFQITKIQFCK